MSAEALYEVARYSSDGEEARLTERTQLFRRGGKAVAAGYGGQEARCVVKLMRPRSSGDDPPCSPRLVLAR